jgi:YD repeat-containing protein
MKNYIKKIFFLAVVMFASIAAFAQEKSSFASGDGGFGIDLPRTGVIVADTPEDESPLGVGKKYSWLTMPDRVFMVTFYRTTDDKPHSPMMLSQLLAGFKEGFLEGVKKNNYTVTEKPYAYKTNKGGEFRVVLPGGISITRFFVTPTRMYMIQTTIRGNAPETEVLSTKVLDTFRLLDATALKAVKIEEATPAPLPQEPPAKKQMTDLQDKNLKGKVKEIIADTVNLPGTRRERSNEKYYDARGNLTKEINFEEGYPTYVEVWGYIDGNRVSNSDSIWFDDDQRPPGKQIIQSMMESPAGPPQGKIDPRFSNRYAYKYDDLGRLIETSLFDNSGERTDRTTYTYSAGRREERNFWDDGEEYNRKAYLLDAAGNIIEETIFDEKGAVDSRTVYRYEFDAAGNWIVQRDFAKKTVRGKTTLKPLSIIYRTITYYP